MSEGKASLSPASNCSICGSCPANVVGLGGGSCSFALYIVLTKTSLRDTLSTLLALDRVVQSIDHRLLSVGLRINSTLWLRRAAHLALHSEVLLGGADIVCPLVLVPRVLLKLLG